MWDAHTRTRLIFAIMIGGACSLISLRLSTAVDLGAGDFAWSLRAARDLLAGRDPYSYPPGPEAIPYPLPAAFVGLPFAWLPDVVAGALFIGVSAGLLVWALLRKDERWRLFLFCSWSFVYSLIFMQWPPLLLVMAFYPVLLPLLLVKPHIALPLALTTRTTWVGIVLTGIIGLVSLLIYPTWPIVWLGQVQRFQGAVPPIFASPLSILLLLALLRWREKRSWLLLLAACMPQRMVYDQLTLFLIPETRREMLWLTVTSWASCMMLLITGGWSKAPGGWQLWVLLCNYFPALLVVLSPLLFRQKPDA